MEVVHKKCAGLDVHSGFVVACGRTIKRGKIQYEEARFETTTRALLDLKAWLEARGLTQVVMEATGVYWKPVWHILEGPTIHLILANAQAVRGLPGSPKATRTMRAGLRICWRMVSSRQALCRLSRSRSCARTR